MHSKRRPLRRDVPQRQGARHGSIAKGECVHVVRLCNRTIDDVEMTFTDGQCNTYSVQNNPKTDCIILPRGAFRSRLSVSAHRKATFDRNIHSSDTSSNRTHHATTIVRASVHSSRYLMVPQANIATTRNADSSSAFRRLRPVCPLLRPLF